MLARSLLLASLLTLIPQLPASAAAVKLHWPLPENSLAQNGTPQKMVQHTKLPTQMPKIRPLPNKGLHPKAAAGLKRPYSGTAIDVLQYHNDNYPTGWNQSETDLTPATVGSANFGQLTTLNVDGNVIAQPLMVSNFQMPDGHTHNVLIVATGHDTVYAFDAQDYSILWQVSMGKPQTSGDVGCSDVVPEYGISSTPVIVRNGNSATIYLVAATEPAHLSFHTQLHALDLATGADVKPPREIDPQAKLADGSIIHFDPQNQWSRTSLLYGNGSLYVGIGSHCDNNAGDISGWMIRYNPANLKQIGRFNTIEAPAGYQLSSIWMAGYPSAMDASGFVYSITGNGNYATGAGKKGYGETVLKLTSDLKHTPADWFTPANFQDLNNGDTDFGSGGAMLIPPVAGQTAPPLLVGMGKASTVYLLDSTNMGRLEGRHGSEPLQKFQVGGGCWCGPAYYARASRGTVYYQAGGDVLRAFSVKTDASPKLKQVAQGTSGAGYGGSFPVVSSNGSTANTALVWLIRRDTTEQLEAYDAVSLGDPLFQSNAGSWNTSGPFLSPLVANGRVYVGAYKTVTVFGLTE